MFNHRVLKSMHSEALDERPAREGSPASARSTLWRARRLVMWLYAAREGAAYNVRGSKDVIAVGFKHDTDDELDRRAWKFRRLSRFTWKKHVDERWEGFRWLCSIRDLSEDPHEASKEVAGRVLAALRRAGAIPESPRAGRRFGNTRLGRASLLLLVRWRTAPRGAI